MCQHPAQQASRKKVLCVPDYGNFFRHPVRVVRPEEIRLLCSVNRGTLSS